MNRLVLVGAVFAGACGGADDRPPTLDYITETILEPSCASAECHSAFRRQVGDQFDTVVAARHTIVANSMVITEDRTAPESSYLVRTLTVGSPSQLNPGSPDLIRMPYDAPIPDTDVELIKTWIRMGFPGAQCEPNANHQGCQVRTVQVAGNPVPEYAVVECNDGNIGAMISTCPGDQVCTVYTGNGQCVTPQ